MSRRTDALDESASGDADPDLPEAPSINSHRATAERTVFTEESNPDGWIATDLTVDCQR